MDLQTGEHQHFPGTIRKISRLSIIEHFWEFTQMLLLVPLLVLGNPVAIR